MIVCACAGKKGVCSKTCTIQNSHPVQKQWRLEWLLFWTDWSECRSEQSAGTCCLHVPWNSVWFQGKKVHHGYGPLTLPSPGEVLGAKMTTVHCLHWLNKSLCPFQVQKVALCSSRSLGACLIFSEWFSPSTKTCILAPALFSIFFSWSVTFLLSVPEDSVYICTLTDDKLFRLAQLLAETKICDLLIVLFANDAMMIAHSEQSL